MENNSESVLIWTLWMGQEAMGDIFMKIETEIVYAIFSTQTYVIAKQF